MAIKTVHDLEPFTSNPDTLDELPVWDVSEPDETKALKRATVSQLPSGGGGASALNDLTDVTIDTPVVTQVLKYDGAKWVNSSAGAAANIAPVSFYLDKNARDDVIKWLGYYEEVASAQVLNSGSPILAGVGQSQVAFYVNAGTVLTGTLTITGTSVDYTTGAETPFDTEDIAVDGLTVNGSTTSPAGNPIYNITNAYITSKWFKQDITISTADLNITDLAILEVGFEPYRDVLNFTVTSFEMNEISRNDAATMEAFLYGVRITGNVMAVSRIGALFVNDTTKGDYYRLRQGNINQLFSGAGGLFVEFFMMPLNQAYWTDINAKIWLLLTPP